MVRNVHYLQISHLMNKLKLTVSDKIAYIFCVKKYVTERFDKTSQSAIEYN